MRARLLLLAATMLGLELLARLLMGGAEQGGLYAFGAFDDGRCVGLRPGAEVTYTGWLLRIPPARQEVNALGFRGPPRPPAGPAGTLRIAALGDSFTYGLGVAAEDAIPAQLEKALRARLGAPVEVLNFGIPGAQLEDLIPQLRGFIARWRPDLVVFLLFDDDLDTSLCEWVRSPARLAVGLLSWTSYLARAFHAGFNFLYDGLRAYGGGDAERATRLGEALAALADASRAAGASLAIVALGDPTRSRRPEIMAQVLDAQRLTWLDARVWRGGPGDEALPLIAGDLHFTAESNRAAAGRIAAWLVGSGRLPRS